MRRNGSPKLKIIKAGTLCCEASEMASLFNQQIKFDLGIGGGSTATLIEAERRILVDTGFDYECLSSSDISKRNKRNIVRALRDWGINPNDIDVVFITHWHRDHFGNLEVFKKAAHLASKGLVKCIGLEGFQGLGNEEEIAEGVKVIMTPGHTIDHASIIVDSIVGSVKARVAIAGDAVVSHSYFQSGQIWQYNADFYSIEVARQSILRLTSLSDIIIPGHGVPFFTFKPKWM
jgi:glyoxylase-like metal-dependent hydrolase (beta-lactamase superfamily II)